MHRIPALVLACAMLAVPPVRAELSDVSDPTANLVRAPASEKGATKRAPARAKPKASKRKPAEAVNLDDLDAGPPLEVTSNYKRLHEAAPPSGVKLKGYFDLALTYRPGASPFSFDNFHSVFLLDFIPSPELQFGVGFAAPTFSPQYYEMTYEVAPRWHLRFGRIPIPFDLMSPHNTFGGFVNTSRVRAPNQEAFLPDIWADLGAGVRWVAIDTPELRLEPQLYLVNGFQDGGIDPRAESVSYPDFETIPNAADNNDDKSIGGRVHAKFHGRWGAGLSFYTGRWSDSGEPSGRIFMLGLDAQAKLTSRFEFRTGYAFMNVGLPLSASRQSFQRGGLYGEGIYRLHEKLQGTLRGGIQQNDSGVADVNDRAVFGFKIDWFFNPMFLFSFQYYRDFRAEPGKNNLDFAAIRAALTI